LHEASKFNSTVVAVFGGEEYTTTRQQDQKSTTQPSLSLPSPTVCSSNISAISKQSITAWPSLQSLTEQARTSYHFRQEKEEIAQTHHRRKLRRYRAFSTINRTAQVVANIITASTTSSKLHNLPFSPSSATKTHFVFAFCKSKAVMEESTTSQKQKVHCTTPHSTSTFFTSTTS
jgi:hypothetical protein